MTGESSPSGPPAGGAHGRGSGGRGYWVPPSLEGQTAAPGPAGRTGAGGAAPEPPPPAWSAATSERRGGQPRRADARVSRRRRKSRRRRLVRLAVLLVVLAGIGTAVGLVLSGRTVVPVVSEHVFPIHYSAEIAQAAERYGLDPYLVAAVAKTESGYNPEAVSPVGAVGLMQLMPDTAGWITGLAEWQGGSDPELTDPADSLELGACYLAYLEKKFDDKTLAMLAAYNGGPGNVTGWIEEAGGLEEFDIGDIPYEETRDFVQRVTRYWFLYQRVHPDVFGDGGGAAGAAGPAGAAAAQRSPAGAVAARAAGTSATARAA